jgi:hypothetical protein
MLNIYYTSLHERERGAETDEKAGRVGSGGRVIKLPCFKGSQAVPASPYVNGTFGRL